MSGNTKPDHRDALLEFGRIALAEATVEDLMQRIAETAKTAVPPVAEASVTFTRGGDTGWTVASTGQLATDCDELQYRVDGGPCLDAASAGEVLYIRDFARETRWPHYSPNAYERGARSSLSIPIPVQQQVLAALNLYSIEVAGFGDDDVALAKEIASYAAVAVANAHDYESAANRASQLEEAMRSRAIIEQAKGVIMATTRCIADDAFALLRQQSQAENRKLREVAQEVVDRQSS